MATHCHITGALPVATLNEIHDSLTLALDATASRVGYTQSEREARSHVRAALRQTADLIGGMLNFEQTPFPKGMSKYGRTPLITEALPHGMDERLATFARWTGATPFPVEKVFDMADGFRTFSSEFLAYVERMGLSLDWAYLGDAKALVMQAFNAAQEGRS